jgi:hypothetical protein
MCKIVIVNHKEQFNHYLYYLPTDAQPLGTILGEMEVVCKRWCAEFIGTLVLSLDPTTRASCNSLYVSRHHSVTCLLRSTVSPSIMEMYELVWACASHMHQTNLLRLDILYSWARFARSASVGDKLVEILNKLPDIYVYSRSGPDFSLESNGLVEKIKASTERWGVNHKLEKRTVKFLENPRDPNVYVWPE